MMNQRKILQNKSEIEHAQLIQEQQRKEATNEQQERKKMGGCMTVCMVVLLRQLYRDRL